MKAGEEGPDDMGIVCECGMIMVMEADRGKVAPSEGLREGGCEGIEGPRADGG